MRAVSSLATVLVALAVGTSAMAAPKDKIKVNPRVFFDPTGAVCGGPSTAADSDDAAAKWVNKRGISSRPGDFGLFLEKSVPLTQCAAGVADITGFEGRIVAAADVFGYAYRNDMYCGAGAPRISVVVEDSDGDSALYSAGCANPSTTTNTVGLWTTKGWTPANFFFQSGDIAVPLVGSKITAVSIVFDEEGNSILDNIRYNNLVAGGPAAEH